MLMKSNIIRLRAPIPSNKIKGQQKMTNNQYTAQRGFTLLEVMLVLAILSIVVTAAVISFDSWMSNTKSRSAVTTLRTSIHLARLEAIKLGGKVQFCSSSNGLDCGGSLSDGWIVYQDTDADEILGANDPVLFTEDITNTNTTLTMTDSAGNAIAGIGFNHRGYSTQITEFSS